MYNLNKYIANNLIVYVKDENNNSKNSTTFSKYFKNVTIEDDKIMVPLEIASLYANISIIDTLNIMKDCVNIDDQLLGKRLYLKTSFLISLIWF